MPYAAFSAGAIGNMIYCTLRATWPWSSGATCIAHAYRLINRSGRIRMRCLAVYIKPFAASAGAHANACRTLRTTIGKCGSTYQRMPCAQGHRRQSQVHMSMHAARSEPPAAIAGAHINAYRALIATIGKRGCTCQRMLHLKTAIGNRRCTFQCIPCAHSRHRQSQVHISTHAHAHSRQWKRRRNIS